MVSTRALLLTIFATAPSASGLRCNTYIGTDFSHSGPGIESCIGGISRCVMRKFYTFGVRTYSMNCDDLLQCATLPQDICCTQNVANGTFHDVVRCSSSNFAVQSVNASNFGPECDASCPS